MDVREEIKAIAKRLENGEKISEEELKSFMSQARDYMMETSTIVNLSEINKGTIVEPSYIHMNTLGGQKDKTVYYPFTSCSCGAREDSCTPCESYNGAFTKTSLFAVATDGSTIRFSIDKDKT